MPLDTPETLFDFDQPIDRSNSDSAKWIKYRDRDIIPLWVADTDFRSSPAIINALSQRVEHGVFGYTRTPEALEQAVIARFQRLYHWTIDPRWLVWIPGMVCGLNLCCRTYAEPGSEVLIPDPIYPPFRSAPANNQQQAVTVPMKSVDNRWVMDFAALEQAITEKSRLLLFCNPQNPGGTVYRKKELERLVAICEHHDLIIASDEIHAELLLEPSARHIPTATLSAAAMARTITLTGPTKTFNIAGIPCCLAIIPDNRLRRLFKEQRRGIVPDVSVLGYTAALAAYRDSDDWLAAKLNYLRGNHDYLIEAINKIPGLNLAPVEGTYLAWIDISALKLEDPVAFFEAAGVGMSPGKDFGDANFMRLNFGCPRALLEQAVARIHQAASERMQSLS